MRLNFKFLILALVMMGAFSLGSYAHSQDIEVISAEEAIKQEVIDLHKNLLKGGARDLVLQDLESIKNYWGDKGISTESIEAIWNSLILLSTEMVLEQYLWGLYATDGSRDVELESVHGDLLKRLGVSRDLLLPLHRGGEIYKKFKERVDALKAFDEVIQKIARVAASRGLWDYVKVKRFTIYGLYTVERGETDEKQVELDSLLDFDLPQARNRVLEAGISLDYISQRERALYSYLSTLSDRELSTLTSITTGVSLTPFVPVAMAAGGMITGGALLPSSASFAFTGLSAGADLLTLFPIGLMGIKGISTFLIRSFNEPGYFQTQNLYGELLTHLSHAMSYAIVSPLLGGGIAKMIVSPKAVLSNTGKGLFAGLIFLGALQAGEGISTGVQQGGEEGAILISNGLIDLGAIVLILKLSSGSGEQVSPERTAQLVEPTPESPIGSDPWNMDTVRFMEGYRPPSFDTINLPNTGPLAQRSGVGLDVLQNPFETLLSQIRALPEVEPHIRPLPSYPNILVPPFSGMPTLSPTMPSPMTPFTGIMPEEDEETEIREIIRREGGKIISRQFVRVKKGISDFEILSELGLTSLDEVIAVPGTVPLLDPWASVQSSTGDGGETVSGRGSIEEEQDVFGWIPTLTDRRAITLWYINTFLIGLKGGSFHELSIDDIVRYLRAIAESLRTEENLGFHDVAGIRPFQLSATNEVLVIPAEHQAYFTELAERFKTWIHEYERAGFGAVVETLQGVDREQLKAILGESIWAEKAWSGERFAQIRSEIEAIHVSIIQGLNDIKQRANAARSKSPEDQAKEEKLKSQKDAIQRIYEPLIYLEALSELEVAKEKLGGDVSLEEKIGAIRVVIGHLINHTLVNKEEVNRVKLQKLILIQIRTLQNELHQRLQIKEADTQDIQFLVASGLHGLLRGNFCEDPTCATGRNGENHQHRNSTLSKDNLLLVPMIDGEVRGYIELQKMKAVGSEKPILVLRTIQFKGLTQNSALKLFSYLDAKAKEKGLLGVAVPSKMDGKSNLDDNKTIVKGFQAGGTAIAVFPIDEAEGETIRKSFGSQGGVYYEDGVADAYILLNPKNLVSKDEVQVTESQNSPSLDSSRATQEEEKFKNAKAIYLISVGMGIQTRFLSAYVDMLGAYGRYKEGNIIQDRDSRDFFERLVQFLEDETPNTLSPERKEKELKDQVEELFMSVSWKVLAKGDSGWVGDLFRNFTNYLGEERVIRSYQHSVNLRTKVVLGWLPTEWISPLYARTTGNRMPLIQDFIVTNNLTFKVMEELEDSLFESHIKPLFEKFLAYLIKNHPNDINWTGLCTSIQHRPFTKSLEEILYHTFLLRIPSSMALGRLLSDLFNQEKVENKAFILRLIQRAGIPIKEKYPIISIYEELMRLGKTTSQGKKEWLKDPSVNISQKVLLLLSEVGVSGSKFRELFDALSKQEQAQVNQIFDEQGTFNVFLKLAQEQGVEKEFLSIAKVESFDVVKIIKKGGSQTFTMGEGNDTRQVTLTIPHSFQRAQITQLQYALLMGENPSNFQEGGVEIKLKNKKVTVSNLPVEQVSYGEALKYLEKLSELTNQKFRLPTEAEWEHAMRAGTQSTYYWGDDEAEAHLYAWYSTNSNSKTHPVAELQPNAFGLYDMSGNVGEWCQDWYDNYQKDNLTDPQGPDAGSVRVFRGGGWYRNAPSLRSADRNGGVPDYRGSNVGFRLVRED